MIQKPPQLSELCWLADVRQAAQPINVQHPIWIRSRVIESGPCIPPERHPNCEFCLIEQGKGIALVGKEQKKHREGDLLIFGSGVPHWVQITHYPFKFIAIHFLPGILFELAPESDAARMLHRFTAGQKLADRLMRPPDSMREFFRKGFNSLDIESEQKKFGWEAKLRSGLVDMIVELMRHEQKSGREESEQAAQVEIDWHPLERALRFLRQHVAETVYAREVAAAAGVSESRLKVLFRNVMGTSWSHYLQGYRIHLAAARLSEPGQNVLEIALAVGFGNLSHFSSTFRSLMGVSPIKYAKRANQKFED